MHWLLLMIWNLVIYRNFGKIRQMSMKTNRFLPNFHELLQIPEKYKYMKYRRHRNFPKRAEKLQMLALERQTRVNIVDLAKCGKMNIQWFQLQKSASIQPRTDLQTYERTLPPPPLLMNIYVDRKETFKVTNYRKILFRQNRPFGHTFILLLRARLQVGRVIFEELKRLGALRRRPHGR